MTADYTEGKIKEHTSITVNVDGGCEPKNPGGICSSAWVIYDSENKEMLAKGGKVVRDGGKDATANYAEYCAVGLVLRWLKDEGWKGKITIFSDSQLVVNQVNDEWKCKAKHLRVLRDRIQKYIEEIAEADSAFKCLGCNNYGQMDELQGEEGASVCPMCQTSALEFNFGNIMFWISREQNVYADKLTHEIRKHYKENKK